MSIAVAAGDIERVSVPEHSQDQREHLWRVFDAACDGLYRFILIRVGGNRDVADDVVQQTCYLAAKHRSPPTDDDGCEAWLRGIARNLVRNHWRRRKRNKGYLNIQDVEVSRQLAEDMETHPLPPDVVSREESRTQLMLAITELRATDQFLIFAFYFEARSQARIAKELQTTVKSIETRLYRARQRLRTALRDPERMD